MPDADEVEEFRKRVAALEDELAAHRDELAMLRTVTETMPALALRISLDGNIEFINHVLPEYESRPPPGHSIYSFAPADQHEVMREAIETVRRTGGVATYESIALAPDGTRDWYWTVVGPISQAGVLTGLTLICTNITRLKIAERAGLESHERLALALDAGNVGVWRWDSTRDHVEWDDKLCAMFGMTPDQAPTTRADFLALVSDDQRAALSAHIDEAMASGVYVDFEVRADLPDGVRWFVLKGGVAHDATGGVTGLRGGVVDDTSRRRLMEQVREAQKLEALGQLSAGVAHNFNNMLGSIVPALELAAKETRPALSAILGDAKDAAMRAAELVKQLMYFSRRDQARLGRPEPLSTVLRRSLALCRSTFAREITLTDEGLEHTAKVTVDGPQMEQAILNLLLNARDAVLDVPAARVHIEVTAEDVPGLATAPMVALRFRDTGHGMDEATRARVFEPFFTTKPIGAGTGLGLSTAWATVRAHRGSLTCDSTPGAGTTFSLVLPIDTSPVETKTKAEEVPEVRGRGERVLVIDDERALRQSVAALLEASGYRVVTAASGDEGVRLFRETPASLVLLDHSMPGQPPSVTLAQLRALAPGVPVISFSGLGAELAGATAHLRKPVDAATLLAALREALG